MLQFIPGISVRAKSVNKTKNSRKRTQYMCAVMLVWLRKDINFRPVDMYRSLGKPRRTYQDLETGDRGIPADVAEQVRDIHKRNRQLMDNICRDVSLPSQISRYSASEWLRKMRAAEFEAGIIRVSAERGKKL